jgi:hypothetical protein
MKERDQTKVIDVDFPLVTQPWRKIGPHGEER